MGEEEENPRNLGRKARPEAVVLADLCNVKPPKRRKKARRCADCGKLLNPYHQDRLCYACRRKKE